MIKKFLTIGLIVLFLLIFLIPTISATQFINKRDAEESIPITPAITRSIGYAKINGTIETPNSMYPLIGKIFKYRFLMDAYFVNGIIRPVFALTGLRKIYIPDDYSYARIHGTFCRWDRLEQIGDTDVYIVSGTIFPLVVDLYN